MRFRTVTVIAPIVALALAIPAVAEAKISAAVTVEAKDGASRIVAVLASDTTLPARRRPKTVTAVAGAATYKLTRSGKGTGRRLGTWRSTAAKGAAAGKLQALAGKTITLRIRTRANRRVTVSVALPEASAPGTAPAPTTGTTPAPTQAVPTTAPGGVKITPTRDDAAGQAIFRGSDLLLERYKFGSTGLTADYVRIWLYAGGQFRQNTIAWNSVSGESCTDVKLATWTFKEGYTFPEAGGGVLVKVGLAGQVNGEEILVAGNGEPNNVYIGPQLIQFERNAQIQQNC